MSEDKKKIIKLAVIRRNDDTPCPFGLKISWACKNAGSVIERMAPVDVLGSEATEREKNMLVKANMRLLVWSLMGGQEIGECTYANIVFPDKHAVDCTYGDTAPGTKQRGVLLGSPFYSKIFSGIGLDGLYSYPLGFYSDSNISKNLFYGIYSLQGDASKEQLIKLAMEILHEYVKDISNIQNNKYNKR